MESLRLALVDTCLGWMGVMCSPNGLRKIILPQASREAVLNWAVSCSYSVEVCKLALLGDLPQRLRRYLEGKPVHFPDRLDFAGASHFQQDVWQVAQTIPYGETRSYAWIAAQLGLSKASRAVGQALGRNPLPIVVPCHRVIGSDGGLGGFSAGLDMKRHLLRLENACIR